MRKIKNPISVDAWSERLEEDARHPSRGQFRLLTREMVNSQAFRSLSKGGMVMVIAMTDKISYLPKGHQKRKGAAVGVPVLQNGGEFVVTINELVARGISPSSATRARNEAWQKGFFDVLTPGTVHHPGRYRISQRWREYPNGAHTPAGQPRPGINVYPASGRKFTKKEDEGQEDTERMAHAN